MAERICALDGCEKPVPPEKKASAIYCSDRCRKARWDHKRVPCPRCGGEMAAGRGYQRCIHCWNAEVTAGHRERMDDIAQMWNEGATLAEIQAYMGYAENSRPPILSEMMALGLIQARREGYRRRHAERDAA